MVSIETVTTKAQMREFMHLPLKLHGSNPLFVPDLISEEMDYFNPKVNPAYAYCETRMFLARNEKGEAVGRVAGILNKKFNAKVSEHRMRISRLDFIEDVGVARALLGAVEDYARECGMDIVHGPMGFSDLDKEGMLIEGFDRQDLSITIFNEPFYADFMEQCGYGKEADWVEFQLRPTPETTARLEKLAKRVKSLTGVRVAEVHSLKQLDPYMDDIFELVNNAYGHLYGYTPLTKEMQKYYYDEYFKLLNFDYICVVLDKEGKLCGFGLGFPSIAEALTKSHGKLFPFGWARLLSALKSAKILELALIAVRSDLKGLGVNAVLIDHVNRNVVKNGVHTVETGPQLETNDQIQAQWRKLCPELIQHKRRRAWMKKL